MTTVNRVGSKQSGEREREQINRVRDRVLE
jgi:hypothetical protein